MFLWCCVICTFVFVITNQCRSTVSNFSSATLPVRWNFLYKALIIIGCRRLVIWNLVWKLLLVAVTLFLNLYKSSTRKSLTSNDYIIFNFFLNLLINSPLLDYSPQTLLLSININPFCDCVFWWFIKFKLERTVRWTCSAICEKYVN